MENGINKNHLQNEKSLYLQQHASNPIDWYPWGDLAFEKARAENKLMLISIGYSSCHWCHVMEHEVFENPQAAEFLNKYFVCVKVDREERPDIDNTYMLAVQLMTNSGGWPLNCFTLLDGRPVYGGTYFPLGHFLQILEALVKLQQDDPHALQEAAENIYEGLSLSLKVEETEIPVFSRSRLDAIVHNWSLSFDHHYGGVKGAPKFPMPNNYEFLLNYGVAAHRSEVVDFVGFTWLQILRGGIYDQIAGGLMRYSTDEYWKEPHFEKMLNDNAQFLSLLSKILISGENEEIRFAAVQTLEWLDHFMRTPEGFYKSSVDADAAGEEGSYYVWTKKEIASLFGEDAFKTEEYYQINAMGFWKEGKYILIRENSFKDFRERHGMDLAGFSAWRQVVNDKLATGRLQKPAPVIDEKIVFSWNVMLAIAFADLSLALDSAVLLDKARALTLNLEKRFIREGRIFRIAEAEHLVPGFLEDYAWYIRLCVSLHQLTLEEIWIEKATACLKETESIFEKNGSLFCFAKKDPLLLADTVEQSDNVIPASNSVLAHSYWDLGVLCSEVKWLQQAQKMLAVVYGNMERYGSAYSNWAMLLQKILVGDVRVSYFSEISSSAHLAIRRENPPEILFRKEIQGEEASVFQICAHGSCALPERGFEKISPSLKVYSLGGNKG